MDKSNLNIFKENNTIFSNSWLFNIPLDLSTNYDEFKNCNEKENNFKVDTSKNSNNFIYRYLPKNLINILFEDNSDFHKKESSSNNKFNYKLNSYSVCENLNKKKLLNSDKEKIEEVKNSRNFYNNFISNVNNYNINIYNPSINYVNIFYPSKFNNFYNSLDYSNFEQVTNPKNSLNENFNSNGKFSNYINTSQFINKSIGINFNKTNINNSYIEGIEIQTYNNNIIIKNKQNKQYKNHEESKHLKKKKKKNKKKTKDEYTIEVFGRLGWICENCINFNYDSRKNCNRCKLIKNPIKKEKLLGEEGLNIINNLINGNHKGDWKCYYCGNINYSFRTKCNKCQNPKEEESIKFETKYIN